MRKRLFVSSFSSTQPALRQRLARRVRHFEEISSVAAAIETLRADGGKPGREADVYVSAVTIPQLMALRDVGAVVWYGEELRRLHPYLPPLRDPDEGDTVAVATRDTTISKAIRRRMARPGRHFVDVYGSNMPDEADLVVGDLDPITVAALGNRYVHASLDLALVEMEGADEALDLIPVAVRLGEPMPEPPQRAADTEAANLLVDSRRVLPPEDRLRQAEQGFEKHVASARRALVVQSTRPV